MTTRDSLAESITTCFGFTTEEAHRIIDVYLEVGAVRFDKHGGGATLAHGALWDPAPMKEALKTLEESS